MPNQMLSGPGKGVEDKRNAAVGSKVRAALMEKGIDPRGMSMAELASKYPGEVKAAVREARNEAAKTHGFGSGVNSAIEFMKSQTE